MSKKPQPRLTYCLKATQGYMWPKMHAKSGFSLPRESHRKSPRGCHRRQPFDNRRMVVISGVISMVSVMSGVPPPGSKSDMNEATARSSEL